MHQICFFCNTIDRTQFRQLLANNSCPYFWQHDSEYCRDTANDVGENYISYGQYDVLSSKYYSYRKSLDPTLNLNLARMDDFLNLTVLRYQNNDHLGERSRGEYPYLCYCPSSDRYGVQCDAYTRIVYPFFNEVLPVMAFICKMMFGVMFFIIVVIPKVITGVQKYVQYGKRMHLAIFTTLFTNLDCVGGYVSLISIIINAVRDIVQPYNPTAAGILNIISFVLLGISIQFLLVHWLHIYDSASEMMIDAPLNKKNKIILAIMLILMGILLIFAIVGGGVATGLRTGGYSSTVANDYFTYFNMSLFLLAVAILGGFAIGFLVYGLRMYRILKMVDNTVSLLKLRFTRLMIIVDVSFLHFMLWMIVLAIDYPMYGFYGPFMSDYSFVFVYLSMFATFTAIATFLYSTEEFKIAYTKICK
jgi:hypothetical protein